MSQAGRTLPPIAPPPRKVASNPPAPPGPPPRNGSSPPSRASAPPLRQTQPSRTGLPPIAPPPRKVASNPPHANGSPFDELAQTVTAVASPHAQPTRKGDPRAEVDLDWSDEEESTHVYGKGEEEPEPPQPPRGPYDPSSVIAPQAPMSAPSLREPSSQFSHRASVPHPPPLDMRRAAPGSESEPPPHQLRETTRGARIVPPALLSSGTAPPGPASQLGREPPRDLDRSPSVTEPLPQGVEAVARFPEPRRAAAPTAAPASIRPPAAAPYQAPTSSPAERASYRPPPPAPIVQLAAPAQEPPRRTGVIVAAIAAVLVAMVAVFFLLGRKGELIVDVRDPKGAPLPRAEIFIDGRKVCDSTPCVVSDLEAGTRLVKATAPGFQTPAPSSAEIVGGKRGELVITLPLSTGSLAAKGDQPGVKVYVDGVDRGALPAKLEDLQPGAREVRFDGGERYKSLERVVDVKAGEVTDLGAVRLDVLRGQITIELGVSGRSDDVRVTIQKDQDNAAAKVVAGPFPKTIELDGSAKWRVLASKRGLPDYVARFDFTDGIAVKTVRISMEPEKAATEAPPEPPPSAPAPGPAPGPAPTPPPAKDPPKEEPKEPVASGTGTVNINSKPVSRVLVDGTPMGETPLSGVQLPVGLHTVTFIHPELGRKSVVVKVEAGKTAVASARLRD